MPTCQTKAADPTTGATGLDTPVNNCAKRPPLARFVPDWKKAETELHRIHDCGSKVNLWKHKVCGAWWTRPLSCNSRWCPRCGRRRADALVDKYLNAVSRFKRPALITLTVPNCGTGFLGLHIQVLAEGLKRLRRRKIWPARQGLYSIEVKWTSKKKYHPHIHMLVDWNWTDLKELSATWKKITEQLFRDFGEPQTVSHQPDVKLVSGSNMLRALSEVIKYGCGVKRGEASSEFPTYPPEVQLEIAATLSGTRMIQPFGKLKAEKPPKATRYCPHCGTQYVSWLHASHWKRDVYEVDELAYLQDLYLPELRYEDWRKEYDRTGIPERRRAP